MKENISFQGLFLHFVAPNRVHRRALKELAEIVANWKLHAGRNVVAYSDGARDLVTRKGMQADPFYCVTIRAYDREDIAPIISKLNQTIMTHFKCEVSMARTKATDASQSATRKVFVHAAPASRN